MNTATLVLKKPQKLNRLFIQGQSTLEVKVKEKTTLVVFHF